MDSANVKLEEGTPAALNATPAAPAPPPATAGGSSNGAGPMAVEREEEYDPSRPSFPSFAPSPAAGASSSAPDFPMPPPPPPTGTPGSFPPVPNFAGLPPHLLGLGPPPPPPPGFLAQFWPPPPGGFPGAPPPPPNPYAFANAPPMPAAYLPPPPPPPPAAPAAPKQQRPTKPIPSGPRAQNSGGRGGKKGRSANISDNLRRALYQDEKYILHEPVWKVVGGQMTRLHFVETSPSNLPITKVIATSKLDAISIHARLLEKSAAAIYYSDGSMKNGWAWGAAVEWIRDGTAQGKVGTKLREELGMCDPTDAEMGAVRKALEAFSMVGTLERDELIVFTDSQAAITLIDSGIRYQSQLFMSTLERTLTLHPTVKVTLVWVPGHVGIAGNELADRTAVSGSTTSFLARRAGRLPGVPDQGGDVPVLLSRKVGSADDGAEDGEVGEEKTMPLDDSLTAREGSLFIARFPEAATANDLEVLFGQFGKLASIDMFSIPPVDDRFAILSFVDPTVVDEAIQWLDDQPVTLPTRYAEGRDCEVWKGWQGSLKVARNEVGRLVPASVAKLFKGLPKWATSQSKEHEPAAPPTEEELAEEPVEEIVPHSGHGSRTHGAPATEPSPASGRQPLPPQKAAAQANFHATPSAEASIPQPAFAPPAGGAPQFSMTRGRSISATPSADANAPPQKRYEDMTPSERFLLTYEGFGPGPGNKPVGAPPTGPASDRKRRRKSRDHLPPVPVSTLTGEHHAAVHQPPPHLAPAAPSPHAHGLSPAPGAPTGHHHHHPRMSFSPDVRTSHASLDAAVTPSTFASGLPASVTPNNAHAHPPAVGDEALPTTIADMARLILELQADNTYLDAQHSRLTIVTREPADWSLALAALANSILKEQEALENARRQRVKAEDQVVDWENVLQRNNVGIEERRGFVLDVLDVLDASAMDDPSIIGKLRQQLENKTAALRQRMALLPPTTAQIVQSCEDIFTTLNRALEEQKAALDEAERRSSVLGGLVSIRRDSKGSWRSRREEIDLVVQQLMGPPPPTAPAAMRYH